MKNTNDKGAIDTATPDCYNRRMSEEVETSE